MEDWQKRAEETPVIRMVKIEDGVKYSETDESFRRRLRGEDGPIEYSEEPDLV